MVWLFGIADHPWLSLTLLLKDDNVSVEPIGILFIPQHTQPHLILSDGEVIRLIL